MAAKPICSIPDCGKPGYKCGWCGAHYSRWKRYGDPLGGSTYNGETLAFLESALAAQTDECIGWPFSKDHNGRGKLKYNGRMSYASRVVCERAHGAPPTPKHDAAHSCGKGHEGCINHRHLRWATRAENHADKLIHGTHCAGSKNGKSKLTANDVRKIRKRLANGEIEISIARDFCVTRHAVSAIRRGISWSWLE